MKTHKQLESMVKTFNSTYEIGDEITIIEDDGNTVLTEVSSLAYIHEYRNAVIHVKDLPGRINLNKESILFLKQEDHICSICSE